jgi:hypothetical protein
LRSAALNRQSGRMLKSILTIFVFPQSIHGAAGERVRLQLISMDGKKVYENTIMSYTEDAVVIPVKNISAGMYVLRATTSENNFVKRISIVK